jgi:hypothetical protein
MEGQCAGSGPAGPLSAKVARVHVGPLDAIHRPIWTGPIGGSSSLLIHYQLDGTFVLVQHNAEGECPVPHDPLADFAGDDGARQNSS